MKRKWTIVLLVLLLCLSLVACSRSKKNSGDQTAPPSETAETIPGGNSEGIDSGEPDGADSGEPEEFEGLDTQDEVIVELDESEAVGSL